MEYSGHESSTTHNPSTLCDRIEDATDALVHRGGGSACLEDSTWRDVRCLVDDLKIKVVGLGSGLVHSIVDKYNNKIIDVTNTIKKRAVLMKWMSITKSADGYGAKLQGGDEAGRTRTALVLV